MTANPANFQQAFDHFNNFNNLNHASGTSFDVEAFLGSILAQEPIPLGKELMPSALSQGLGIASDPAHRNQASNGLKEGSTKMPPLSSTRQHFESGQGIPAGFPPRTSMFAANVRQDLNVAHNGRLPDGISRPPLAAEQATLSLTKLAGTACCGAAPQAGYIQQQQQQQRTQDQPHQSAYANSYQQHAIAAYMSASQGQYGSAWASAGAFPYFYPGAQQYAMPYQVPYQSMGPNTGNISTIPASQQSPAGQDTFRGGGADGDEARAVKKPRLIWTEALHRRFLESVGRCGGVERAQPKAIMKEMCVNGLTRENVASHLQKYRGRLKKDPDEEDDEHDENHAGDDDHDDATIKRNRTDNYAVMDAVMKSETKKGDVDVETVVDTAERHCIN